MNNLFYSIEEENREKNTAVVEGTILQQESHQEFEDVTLNEKFNKVNINCITDSNRVKDNS